jgi:hypothetical protein
MIFEMIFRSKLYQKSRFLVYKSVVTFFVEEYAA